MPGEKVFSAWKGYKFEVLDELQSQGLIKQIPGGKSLLLNDEGKQKARELLKKYIDNWLNNPAAILILIFFATDLHGLSRIFTDGYLFFYFNVNLLNSSVLIRVSPCLSVAKIRIAVYISAILILTLE